MPPSRPCAELEIRRRNRASTSLVGGSFSTRNVSSIPGDPFPGVIGVENENGNDDRCKFQTSEIDLVCEETLLNALHGLGEPETGPQVHQQRRGTQRQRERHHDRPRDFPHPVQQDGEQDDEDKEGKHLEREPGRENVVGDRRVLVFAFRRADGCGARDLHHGGDHVAEDEDDQDQPGAHGRILRADRFDEEGGDGVDGGGEKHGRHD